MYKYAEDDNPGSCDATDNKDNISTHFVAVSSDQHKLN